MAKTIRRDELQQAIAVGGVTVVETLRTGQVPTLLLDKAARVETAATVEVLQA
jgi:hypothetical protein